MTIGTNFHYNNHIAFISLHTKTGTLYEKAPITTQMEMSLLIRLFFNIVT